MSGAVRTVKKVISGGKSSPAPAQAAVRPAPARDSGNRGAEMLAAMMRARRGSSRALLSQTRLTGEQGISTLGERPEV